MDVNNIKSNLKNKYIIITLIVILIIILGLSFMFLNTALDIGSSDNNINNSENNDTNNSSDDEISDSINLSLNKSTVDYGSELGYTIDIQTSSNGSLIVSTENKTIKQVKSINSNRTIRGKLIANGAENVTANYNNVTDTESFKTTYADPEIGIEAEQKNNKIEYNVTINNNNKIPINGDLKIQSDKFIINETMEVNKTKSFIGSFKPESSGKISINASFNNVSDKTFIVMYNEAPACSDIEVESRTISNVYELQCMSEQVDGKYELTSDINASVTKNWNDGKGFKPVGEYASIPDDNYFDKVFIGSLDGNNHTINNLYINRSDEDYIGIFGYASPTEIKDLNIKNINVTVSNGRSTGGLIGSSLGHPSISNININGSIRAEKMLNTGGLIGTTFSGTGVKIDNSVSDVNINHISYKCNDGHTGGVVGRMGTSIYDNITSTVNKGDINGNCDVGGIVGYADQELIVENVRNEGDITGKNTVGGVFGFSESDAPVSVKSSENNGDVTGVNKVGGLIGESYSKTENSSSSGKITGDKNVGELIGLYNE